MKATIGDFLWGSFGGIVFGLIAYTCCACSFDVDRGSDAPDASIATSPDAAPMFVTLRQTDDGVIEPLAGARCQSSPPFGATSDQAWLRVFDLPSEDIAGSFALTDVHLRLAYARDARGVQVKIGTYAGAYGAGAAAMTMGDVSWLVTSAVDLPDAGGPFDVNLGGAQAVATFPTGARFVVGVFAPSYLATGGALRLGFTVAPERAPSYFASSSCGVSPPASTEAMGSLGHLVLEVSGWASP